MIDLKKLEVWFVTGSQHLYGEETLKTVAEHTKTIGKALDKSPNIPVQVTFKPIVTTPDAIYKICQAATLGFIAMTPQYGQSRRRCRRYKSPISVWEFPYCRDRLLL